MTSDTESEHDESGIAEDLSDTTVEESALGSALDPQTALPVLSDREQHVDMVLDGWLASMRDSPVSRDTACWNYVVASLPALRAALIKEGES